MRAIECAAAVHNAVSRVGGAFMVDPGVSATADRLGLGFFEFYIAGRAGVLGAVGADAVGRELAMINPDSVTAAWTTAMTRVDPDDAAAAYADCNHAWGRRRLPDGPDTRCVATLGGAVVDALPVDDLPLVAGWRDLPRPDDPVELAAHLLQTLREFRGAVHARAVLAAGLHPVEAIVAGPDGPERAVQLGWSAPFPDPAPLAGRRRAAEVATDEAAAAQFQVLTPEQREQFHRATDALLAAVRRPDPARSG